MRELVGGKNKIGRKAAVLKRPHKATFNFTFTLPYYSHHTACIREIIKITTQNYTSLIYIVTYNGTISELGIMMFVYTQFFQLLLTSFVSRSSLILCHGGETEAILRQDGM